MLSASPTPGLMSVVTFAKLAFSPFWPFRNFFIRRRMSVMRPLKYRFCHCHKHFAMNSKHVSHLSCASSRSLCRCLHCNNKDCRMRFDQNWGFPPHLWITQHGSVLHMWRLMAQSDCVLAQTPRSWGVLDRSGVPMPKSSNSGRSGASTPDDNA